MGNALVTKAMPWVADGLNSEAALEYLKQLLASNSSMVVSSRAQLVDDTWQGDDQQHLASLFEDEVFLIFYMRPMN